MPNLYTLVGHPAIAPFLAVGPLQTRGIIGALFIGLIVGIIAKLVTPGRDPAGCIVTIIIGIVGSYLALFIGRLLGFYNGEDAPGFIGSVIGAIILLLIYHAIFRRKNGTRP